MYKKLLLLCILLMFAMVGNASADPFQLGGDRLVDLQQDDGGWDWPLDDGVPGDASALNTVGPIAMGLAQAYRQTGDAEQLDALEDAGDFLLSKTNYFSPSDGYLAAELDCIFGVTTYTDYVVENYYASLTAGTYEGKGGGPYTTESYIEYIDTARTGSTENLGAWDIGMGLAGTIAAGYTVDIDYWVAGVEEELSELDSSNYYYVLGLAGGLYGLASYDDYTGDLTGYADLLAAYIYSYSEYLSIQTLSYAILALNEFDAAGYSAYIAIAAACIEEAQLETGGWENYAGYGENNEMTGEALWALSTAASVPEPSTLLLIGSGLVGLAGFGRKKLKK